MIMVLKKILHWLPVGELKKLEKQEDGQLIRERIARNFLTDFN